MPGRPPKLHLRVVVRILSSKPCLSATMLATRLHLCLDRFTIYTNFECSSVGGKLGVQYVAAFCFELMHAVCNTRMHTNLKKILAGKMFEYSMTIYKQNHGTTYCRPNKLDVNKICKQATFPHFYSLSILNTAMINGTGTVAHVVSQNPLVKTLKFVKSVGRRDCTMCDSRRQIL